jgi:hypothetical protein
MEDKPIQARIAHLLMRAAAIFSGEKYKLLRTYRFHTDRGSDVNFSSTEEEIAHLTKRFSSKFREGELYTSLCTCLGDFQPGTGQMAARATPRPGEPWVQQPGVPKPCSAGDRMSPKSPGCPEPCAPQPNTPSPGAPAKRKNESPPSQRKKSSSGDAQDLWVDVYSDMTNRSQNPTTQSPLQHGLSPSPTPSPPTPPGISPERRKNPSSRQKDRAQGEAKAPGERKNHGVGSGLLVFGTSNVMNNLDTEEFSKMIGIPVRLEAAMRLDLFQTAVSKVDPSRDRLVLIHCLGNDARNIALKQKPNRVKANEATEVANSFCDSIERDVLAVSPDIRVLISLLLPRFNHEVRF